MSKVTLTQRREAAKIQLDEYNHAADVLVNVPFGEITSWIEFKAYQIMTSYSYQFSLTDKNGGCIFGIPSAQKTMFLKQARRYAKVVCDFFFLVRENPPMWYKKGVRESTTENLRLMDNNFKQAFDIRARQFDLDSYMVALEWYRPIDEQFYLPRRKFLMNLETVDGKHANLIQDGQDLIDGKLDFLFHALPQRTGKSMTRLTVLSLMAIKDLMNKGSRSIFNLCHSAGLARHFYNATLRFFIDQRTYRTLEIFPEISVFYKNNEYKEITLCKEQNYPTFADKSVDGDVTGSTESSLCASADDLIKDPSEVLNPDVADKIYDKVNTYIFGRKKKGVPIYGAATLWGERCPFTRIIELYENSQDERIRINLIPCFNSRGESQFDYEYNLGFDTKHFREIERRMATTNYPLWSALYLAKPIPVEGRLFDSLLYFRQSELEALRKQKKLFVCCPVDVAVKKRGDYLAAPIMEVDEEERIIYISDMCYSNEGTDYTIPRLVELFRQYRVERAEFEEKEGSNQQNQIDYGIKAEVRRMLLDLGHRCYMNNHSGAGLKSKGTRIDNRAVEIAGVRMPNRYIIMFLHPDDRQTHSEYNIAMAHLMAYSQSPKLQGKQKDDLPDALSMGIDYLIGESGGEVEIYSMKTLLPV